MKLRNHLTFFTLLVASLAARSQTTKSLTLDDAVKIGIESSQQLKIAGARLDVSKAKTLQLWNAQLPNVTLNSAYARVSDNITPYSFKFPGATDAIVLNPQVLNQFSNRLSVQQYVFTGYRAKNTLESAVFLQKAATLDVEKDRIEVKNNIIAAYLNLLKLQSSKAIFTENINVLRGRLNDVKNFVKSGTALENDQLKSEIAVSQIELSLKEVENAQEVANFNMDLMLGLPTDTRLELDNKELAEQKELAGLSTYLNSVDARPDLTAADFRRQVSLKNVEIAKGAALPTIAVGGNFIYSDPNPRVFPPKDAFKGTWDLGIQLSYNLTNLYTNKAQVAEAQANVVVSNAQKQQLSDAAKMEINANFYAYQSATERIKLMEKTIVQTSENQRVMKNRYQAQVSTIGELLDADAMVLQAKLNLEIAKADAVAAYYKLQKSVGK
jgi:outer membrane protein